MRGEAAEMIRDQGPEDMAGMREDDQGAPQTEPGVMNQRPTLCRVMTAVGSPVSSREHKGPLCILFVATTRHPTVVRTGEPGLSPQEGFPSDNSERMWRLTVRF